MTRDEIADAVANDRMILFADFARALNPERPIMAREWLESLKDRLPVVKYGRRVYLVGSFESLRQLVELLHGQRALALAPTTSARKTVRHLRALAYYRDLGRRA